MPMLIVNNNPIDNITTVGMYKRTLNPCMQPLTDLLSKKMSKQSQLNLITIQTNKGMNINGDSITIKIAYFQ